MKERIATNNLYKNTKNTTHKIWKRSNYINGSVSKLIKYHLILTVTFIKMSNPDPFELDYDEYWS